jgi:hypothetical protein
MSVRCRRFRWSLPLALATVGALASGTAFADVTKDECIDANSKAQDLRREGKLSSASEQLRACASPSCPTMVRDDCTRRLDELDKAQPTIVFEAKDSAGRDLTAVKVTVDGKPLVESLNGTAVAVDPGAHTFTFEVAGQSPITQQFVLSEGEKGRREHVVIAVAAASAVPAPTPGASGEPPTQPATPVGPNTTKRIAGYITGGVGIGLLGLGTYYAVTAGSRYSDSKTAASSPDPNVQATRSTLYDQAKQAQTYEFVWGGIGLAAIATGLVLVLTSGAHTQEKASSVRVRPTIGVGSAGFDIFGTW